MASRHDPTSGFIELWPTIVLNRTLPGHERANDALARLIESLDRDNRDLTTDYRTGDFLAIDDPGVGWLRECVNVTVRDYFAHLRMTYPIRWRAHGWANVNRFGDYHDSHNHPHAYLSGTYYVRVPEPDPDLRSRRDVRPGRITLYDPRGAVNMTAIKDDPYVEPEHTVTPQPGMILLWPAFVYHFVHPNLSHDPRISVSFNIMLDWSDEYLPAQE